MAYIGTDVINGGYKPIAYGTATITSNDDLTINLGFKPKYFVAQCYYSPSQFFTVLYDESVSTTQFTYANAAAYLTKQTISSSVGGNLRLHEVTNNGVVLGRTGSTVPSATVNYFAIG